MAHFIGRSGSNAAFLLVLVALVTSPVFVATSPILGEGILIGTHILQARQDTNPPNTPGSSSSNNNNNNNNNNSSSSDGSISMSVWLPILLVTLVFALFSFCACVRRCAVGETPTATTAAATTVNGNAAAATRPRRRPRRTPSQISTKSLPPYMKEPGDLELVLFRGPEEDGEAPPPGMPTLAEDDEEHEHPEMRGATFDIALNRIESYETMADVSTTNLVRRPPELHHSNDHRRSGDGNSLGSIGSEAELLATHQRAVSTESQPDPRGEAPSYSEAVAAEGAMSTISLNDPESGITLPPNVANPAGGHARSRSRFNFHNPFSSHHDASEGNETASRSESPAFHGRSGSALSRFSSRESHDSQHSRAPSRSNNHSRSTSNLFRAFRSHSPGLQAGSSTISLDNISAPLTHTAKRAEFHAPKGGLLTADQIKLITSREALGKFGVPYGPDAVAAFSKEQVTEMPPPDFESATGEHEEAVEGAVQSSEQTVQVYASDEEEADGSDGDPRTARPFTPRTARPGRS